MNVVSPLFVAVTGSVRVLAISLIVTAVRVAVDRDLGMPIIIVAISNAMTTDSFTVSPTGVIIIFVRILSSVKEVFAAAAVALVEGRTISELRADDGRPIRTVGRRRKGALSLMAHAVRTSPVRQGMAPGLVGVAGVTSPAAARVRHAVGMMASDVTTEQITVSATVS